MTVRRAWQEVRSYLHSWISTGDGVVDVTINYWGPIARTEVSMADGYGCRHAVLWSRSGAAERLDRLIWNIYDKEPKK